MNIKFLVKPFNVMTLTLIWYMIYLNKNVYLLKKIYVSTSYNRKYILKKIRFSVFWLDHFLYPWSVTPSLTSAKNNYIKNS